MGNELTAEPGYHFDENGTYRDDQGRALCGARTKSGKPCKHFQMDNGRCRLHGGLTPSGVFSPHFKHGRYSAYLPGGIDALYKEAMQDPEIINVRPDIALLDTRIFDLLTRLGDDSESVSKNFLFRMRDLWGYFLQHERSGKELERQKVIAAISELLEAGVEDYQIWGEVVNLVDQRRRLVDTEIKRVVAGQHVLSIERVWLIVTLITQIINDNVSDDKERTRIAAEFRKRIVGVPSGLS